MMKCTIFYETIATTPKKSCGLMTKINKQYLFWLILSLFSKKISVKLKNC